MKKLLLLFLCVYCVIIAKAQANSEFYPLINSIGFSFDLSSHDTSAKASCVLFYGEQANSTQRNFDGSIIWVNGKRELRGSFLNLKPNTLYYIQGTLNYGDATTKSINTQVKTLAEPNIKASSNIKYVSPTGSGTNYTASNPGNIKTLFASGLTCGTTVLLKGGTYSTGDIQLNLLQDCDSASPIVIMAAPNETPILDGGDYTQYTWTRHPSDTNLYFTTIKPELEYNSLCLMDSVRLYPYGFLTPWSIDPTYPCLTSLNFEQSGFYRSANLVYIKTLDHKNPNNASIVFSKYFYCLQVQGNRHQNYIYFKGIQFKNYGKGTCTKDILGNPTCYPSFTVDFQYANHVIIDSCQFTFCNLPLGFSHNCNQNIIQHCTFIDGIGQWSHGAFKQTRDENILERGTYGRYLEYSSINMLPDDTIQKGFIIRYNTVKGSIGGLVGQRITNTERIEETEINNNKVSYCYNGINADGGSANTRIWQNEIDHCSVGLSFISASLGPNYIFRNNIHHIIERKNQHFDVFFMDCNNVLSTKIWGTGVKLNASPRTIRPPEMFFINNTFHTQDTLGFCMYLWNSTWKKLYSRNNIFYSEGMSSLFFDGPKDDTTYSFDSKYDCYFNKTNGKAAIVQPTNGIPVCSTYTNATVLGLDLKFLSKAQDVSITNDFNISPGFMNVNNDLHLQGSSILINAGTAINGFYDYAGSAPDIGAYETGNIGIQKSKPSNSLFQVYPNPATNQLQIEIDGNPKEWEYAIYSIQGQILQTGILLNRRSIIEINTLASGIYFIQVGDSTVKFVKE